MLLRIILITVILSLVGGVIFALISQPASRAVVSGSSTAEIRFQKNGTSLPLPSPLKNLFTRTEKQSVSVGSLKPLAYYDYKKEYALPVYGQAEDAVPPLDSDELGILIRDDYVPRFYPIRTLYDAGILNDRATNHAFVIVAFPGYVPRVYNRTLNGKTLNFAPSGYQNDGTPLFTDTETNTLWGQKEGKAIMGEMTGSALAPLNYELGTWQTMAQEYRGMVWYMQERPIRVDAVTMK